MGLGDHLICNGLVRSIIQPNEQYSMFILPRNVQSIRFMYRDLKNLSFTILPQDINYDFPTHNNFINQILKYNNVTPSDVILIGVGLNGSWLPGCKTFETSFYKQHNLSIEKKWELFKCDRDFESEKNLIKKLNLEDKKYQFVHDDNRYKIDVSKINPILPVIKPTPGVTSNVFDYCKLIENAEEVHVIESSFVLMIDLLKLNRKTILHRYSRLHEQDKLLFGVPDYRNISSII